MSTKKPAAKPAPKQQKKVKKDGDGEEMEVEKKKEEKPEEVSIHGGDFQHILRVLNTNIDGLEKCPIAFSKIKGIGRRFSNIILKRANIDLTKRYARYSILFSSSSFLSLSFLTYSAGQLKPEEIERVVAVINAPTEHQIPSWFLNRQKDFATGDTKQHVSNALSAALRDDLTRLKKIRY
jgi:small subunit ribosomal protein S18e